jgi:N-alpha-acetyltransferase 40
MRLMGLHEAVAANVPSVEKVMLTCFVSNQKAFAFYSRLGFERDAVTPDAKILRSGEARPIDYVIMSKKVAQGGRQDRARIVENSNQAATNGI